MTPFSTFGRRLVALPGIASIYSLLVAAGRIREKLTANRTYYVRTDGSDSNTGLVDSAGGAFLTLQKAWDVTAGLDLGIYSVTIQVGDGTYTGGIVASAAPVGGSTITIQGNTGTPANAVISTTSADCFAFNAIGVTITLQGFKVQTTTSGRGIYANGKRAYLRYGAMDFGVCAGTHIEITGGAVADIISGYSITGSPGGSNNNHFRINRQAQVSAASRTITLTGTLTFNAVAGFIRLDASSQAAFFSSSFDASGATVTGPRYQSAGLSFINTFGGGASYFPGDSAGTTANGGLYA